MEKAMALFWVVVLANMAGHLLYDVAVHLFIGVEDDDDTGAAA